ncbi:MAG: radical SAM protein [delta proteobacterium ML8_F1]|nr:MAG: radical SAM protein [delta proteobacterium ML8_F1]
MKPLEEIIYLSEKPSRYMGGEFNQVLKPLDGDLIRFAFAFPDIYEVGMSHLGLHILYNLLNDRENIFCERVFSPWVDMEKHLKDRGLDLFTLETKSSLRDMDFIGFTLQYELSYTNILKILELSGIPYYAEEREASHPLVMAGGSCGYNPEPLALIMDLFVIGEGEEITLELLELYEALDRDKEKFLFEAAKIPGVYVPKFYEVTYDRDHRIESFRPNTEGIPARIGKRIVKDMNGVYYPPRMIVPFMDVVHNRAVVEIFRGCTAGCRFCQAGMIYRPVREKTPEVIKQEARDLIDATGYEEISLTSLSTLDYSQIGPLIRELMEEHEASKVGISLPSLRLDSYSVEVLKEVQKVRKTGLTFAVEAGSQRLRDVINKGVTEEDLYTTMESIFSLGWDRVKLYFMLGLPTETMEDVKAIQTIGSSIEAIYRRVSSRKRLTLTISTSVFVPKPHTPFQWEAFDTLEALKSKENFLKDALKHKAFKYQYHDPKSSYLEGVFARGDRRLNQVLVRAAREGIRFDGWQEFFDFDHWMAVFKSLDIDPEFYLRRRDYEETLPWDHIESGVDKAYLIKENEKSKNGELTRDCRRGCTGCGVNQGHLGEVC